MTTSKSEQMVKNGQSIIEYILLISAVIAALIFFFRPGGVFQRSYNGVIHQQGNVLQQDTKKMFF